MKPLRRDGRAVVIHSPATRKTLDAWTTDVVRAWQGHWRERSGHRYGKDFAAFLGERFLTDFDMRHHERKAKG